MVLLMQLRIDEAKIKAIISDREMVAPLASEASYYKNQ
jgi:hypothetical protein